MDHDPVNAFDLEYALLELGITNSMQKACRLPRCLDAPQLVNAGDDMFGRPQQMTAETERAWVDMKTRALQQQGIELLLVSAFRSTEYQCSVIKQKLDEGRTIEDVLLVNAIPGYSEHHTGRAIDLHAGDCEPLNIDFEIQPAFQWLCRNAGKFDFQLSYPRDNPGGIDYEPWHWCLLP